MAERRLAAWRGTRLARESGGASENTTNGRKYTNKELVHPLVVFLSYVVSEPCGNYAGQVWAAPSTRITCPLMNRPASEATKATTEAISCGRP